MVPEEWDRPDRSWLLNGLHGLEREYAAARISSRQEIDPDLALNSFKNFLGLVGTGHAQDLLDHTAET